MPEPEAGDVILRGSLGGGFVVLDAITRRCLAGPMMLADALASARTCGSGRVWQEIVDDRGRPLGRVERIKVA